MGATVMFPHGFLPPCSAAPSGESAHVTSLPHAPHVPHDQGKLLVILTALHDPPP